MDYLASEHLIPVFNFGALKLEVNTPIFIFVVVMVVMVFMNFLLFKPVMRNIRTRQEYVEKVRSNTKENNEQVLSLRETYAQKLARVKGELAKARMDSRREVQASMDSILQSAKKEAEGELNTAMAQLDKDVGQVRTELMQQSKNLSQQLTERMLK